MTFWYKNILLWARNSTGDISVSQLSLSSFKHDTTNGEGPVIKKKPSACNIFFRSVLSLVLLLESLLVWSVVPKIESSKFHLNNSSNQNKIVFLWTPTHGRAKAGRPARTYIQQLCEDTGCCPEDLPEAMNDREKWRERVRDIRATSTTWWWWWWN